MKYKMIASDFDGTIFSHKSFTVPQNVKDAIDDYKAHGGKFVITTGRMFDSILPHLKKLGLHGDLLCLQGAMCYDIDTERELFNTDMTNSSAIKLLEIVEEKGWIAQIYVGRNMLTQKPNSYTDVYKVLCGVTPIYTQEKLSDYVKRTGVSLHKCIVMSTPEEADAKVEFLKSVCPDLDFTKSTPEYVEGVDIKSGKGKAVKRLAESYGLTLNEVAAFGDQTNDVSMLKVAGFSACPKNAVDEVKAVVDEVGDDVENGGMAEFIRRFTY